ncbi:MAG: YncE family protein [Muribaculaceae bacterium]|nr:YncE family protein [Muribaculaceae bacterium]
MKFYHLILSAAMIAGFSSCSDDDKPALPTDYEDVPAETPDTKGAVAGFYVLNEGNMGSNKCTIDLFDYATARYVRNIYPERNPSVVMELGDTGNEIAVYGNRLYIVVSGSHKVEVCDAATAVRIGQVDIASPRYIAFDGDYAYVSSQVGGTGDNGSVVRFNIKTLAKEGSVSVGLGPEQLAVADGYLYVANSQNYGVGRFDSNISRIKLSDFTFDSNIPAGVNMKHLQLDSRGNIWVDAAGNYAEIGANLYKLERLADGTYGTPQAFNVPVANFTIAGDRLYYYATVYDASWNAVNTYGTINTTSGASEGSFITDGTESEIVTPYCIAVQPANGDIFITDARNYVSSGSLRCYTKAGKTKWTVTTGDIPGHIAFVMR